MMLAPDSRLVGSVRSTPNVGERRAGLRPHLLIMHYTGLPTLERSLQVLSDPACAVSAHYVIADDGHIIQMVPERLRAWHAGVSMWAGQSDVNSVSIGIEIQNPGPSGGYPDFGDRQMAAVRDLSLDICRRHDISARNVLAHSDVAPARKADPGEKFDWALLAREGIGHWVEPEPLRCCGDWSLQIGCAGEQVQALQRQLAAYGYGIEATGDFDEWTGLVVKAFQLHFRPARVDGRFDLSTARTLDRLISALPGGRGDGSSGLDN